MNTTQIKYPPYSIIAMFLLVACSALEVSDRSSSDDDDVASPVGITGSSLASFENARTRCGQVKQPNEIGVYEVSCRVVVATNGEEINATGILPETAILWEEPKVSDGLVSSVRCQIDNSSLTQSCSVEVKSFSAKIDFGFKISSKKKERKESVEVLLPYSVKVAAGFVPNLALVDTETRISTKENKDYRQSNGLQSRPFHPSLMKLSLTEPTGCHTANGFYFLNSESVYLLKDGMIRHFAGSHYQISIDQSADALRYKLSSSLARIACNEEEIFLLESTRIVAISQRTSIVRMVKDQIPAQTNFYAKSNFDVMDDGTVFYMRQNDLMRLNSKTGEESVFIKDLGFEYLGDTPIHPFNFKMLENGDYLVLERHNTYEDSEANLYLRKTINGQTSRVPLIRTDIAMIGDDGLVYAISEEWAGILIKSSIVVSDQMGKVVKTSPLNWTRSRGGMYDSIPFGFMSINKSAQIHAYDAVKEEIAFLDPKNNYVPVVDTASDGKVLKDIRSVSILPSHPGFDANGNIIYFDHNVSQFFKLKDSKNEIFGIGSYVDRVNCLRMNGVAYRNNSMVKACINNITAVNFDNQSNVPIIDFGEHYYGSDGMPLEGPVAEVSTANPQAIVEDAKGTIFFTDEHLVRKIEGGVVKTIAGMRVLGPYGEFIGGYVDGPALQAQFHEPTGLALGPNGSVFVADKFNHRIREIYKSPDNTWHVKTVAGKGSVGSEINPSRFSGDNGPALDAELNCPTDIAVTKQGTVYFLDGSCSSVSEANVGYFAKFPPAVLRKNLRLRKIESVERNGRTESIITTVFGGEKNKECGSGKVLGKATVENFSNAVETSLSMICQGVITGFALRDTCDKNSGGIDLAITQGFYSRFGNIVHVTLPCKNQ